VHKFLISGPLCRGAAVFSSRILTLHAPWRHFHELTFLPFQPSLPSEKGIGGENNMKVTSILDLLYQRLDWEAGISSHWQKVSEKSQVTWSPVLRPETITGRVLQFDIHDLCNYTNRKYISTWLQYTTFLFITQSVTKPWTTIYPVIQCWKSLC
jgi:hypothetical protein